MNKEFENLPEVAKRLDGIYWNVELNIYQTEYPILFNAVGFVNGAWYVYQEQQKKIDEKDCDSTEIEIIINDDGLMYESMIERIKELLK